MDVRCPRAGPSQAEQQDGIPGHGIALSSRQCGAACDISDSCKDLIQGLLVADPDKRRSIEDIYSHPWFRVDLPDGATAMNERFVAGEPLGPGFQSLEAIDTVLREATRDA